MKRTTKRVKRDYTRVYAALLLLAAVLIIGAVTARVRTKTAPVGFESVTVHAGDTLWSIAGRYCPETIDKRDYIRDVCRRNGCNADLYPGDVLTVPVYGGDAA